MTNYLTSLTVTQLIYEPTRITPYGESVIDDFPTNAPDKVVCSGVIRFGLSDYEIIYRRTSVPTNEGHRYIRCRSNKHFNEQALKTDLANVACLV